MGVRPFLVNLGIVNKDIDEKSHLIGIRSFWRGMQANFTDDFNGVSNLLIKFRGGIDFCFHF